ncbi:hypothetical protein [Archangium primigenium]|uniref:hypothetical protein n=1 Tax=[Archangium] primigenium TaxID=2792470 RepID=UPI00195EDC00|nr:hypothetical protein [Archangium primigenium]
MSQPPDPRAPMSAQEAEEFDKWDAYLGSLINLYCTKAWAERKNYNDLSDELIRLGRPSPDSGHEFWRVKWVSGEDPEEDALFLWAQNKSLELKQRVAGLDWLTLTTQLYEGDVAKEACRLFPGLSDDSHLGAGLVFFHLRGLIFWD